jgi:hypothetical protein
VADRPADAALALPLSFFRDRRAAVVVLIGGLLGASQIQSTADGSRRDEIFAADAYTAIAVAGYLTIVAPLDSTRSESQLIGLLSTVNTLGRAPGWRRNFQVGLGFGETALLPDSISLVPLGSPARQALLEDHLTRKESTAGTVAVAPMFDRDFRHSVGWVGAWRMVPDQNATGLLSGILVLLAAAVFAVILIPPGPRWSWPRWIAVIAALGFMSSLAGYQALRTRNLARRGAEVILVRTRQLVERALAMRSVPDTLLYRIAHGIPTEIRTREAGDSSPHRLPEDSLGRKPVRVPLRAGRVYQMTFGSRTALLGTYYRTLAAWVAVFGLTLLLHLLRGARGGIVPADRVSDSR